MPAGGGGAGGRGLEGLCVARPSTEGHSCHLCPNSCCESSRVRASTEGWATRAGLATLPSMSTAGPLPLMVVPGPGCCCPSYVWFGDSWRSRQWHKTGTWLPPSRWLPTTLDL